MDQYFPKGGMCRACLHRDIDCSHLDFSTMRVLSKDGNDHYVKCSGFARRPFGDIMRDPVARQTLLESAAEGAVERQKIMLAAAEHMNWRYAEEIRKALKLTVINVTVTDIPDDKLEAYQMGAYEFEQKLFQYAEALERGEVNDRSN